MLDLFDTHAHLQEPEFENDLDAVVARAHDAGVTSVLVPGVDARTSEAALALAGRHEGIFVAAGYHPHEASHFGGREAGVIEALLARPPVVAIGEIGLDFYRLHSPREAQLHVFEAMLDLAARHALPVIVHCREDSEALYPLIAGWAKRVAGAFGRRPLGVMHYFAGDVPEARRYVELGFLISVHTSVTHSKSERLREVAAAVPLDRLVIETDSPYGAPQAHRGKRNEPAHVIEAAAAIARLRGLTPAEVARVTTANALRLFGLPASRLCQEPPDHEARQGESPAETTSRPRRVGPEAPGSGAGAALPATAPSPAGASQRQTRPPAGPTGRTIGAGI